MRSVIGELRARFSEALSRLGPEAAGADPLVRPASDAQFGDYQSNVAMSLARALKRPPREVASRIVEHLDVSEMCEAPEVAGPGFINLRLRTEYLARRLEAIQTDARLGIGPDPEPEHVLIDFSSPNLAKEMHVGHLRTTITGEVIARVLEFLGHRVDRINHVGDWGTQFGMLLQYVREAHPQVLERPEEFHVRDLEALYREAKRRFDEDEAFAQAARRAVVELQSGEPTVRRIWEAFCRESLRHCHEIYDLLGVRLTDVGESFYNEMLPEVVEELRAKGLAVESEGAICVFLEGFRTREGEPLPMIIRKSDGGYTYDTTDLAALRYRIREVGAKRIIYVTDTRQAQHFAMLFAAARKAGWAGDDVRLEHLGYGMILGPDRRPYKTREGETVKLRDLIEEAIRRARSLIEANERDPERRRGFTPEQIEQIARAVGIGAIKYADLSHNLASDYVFDWDEMLAMDGNTAPYMLYAYARIRSIGRKAGVAYERLPGDIRLILEHPTEQALARWLVRFPEVIEQVASELRPNLLTDYLYQLSRAFSLFYDKKRGVRVRDASPEAVRLSRLRLCDLTARTLRLGLNLLSIDVVEAM